MATRVTLTPPKRRNSKNYPPEFRLVLVGKTGAGKSSSGNTILGRDAFCAAVSQSSVSRHCCKESGEVFSRELVVVDTPGLFDTGLPDIMVKREISKCINMSAPGPHAILLVIKVGVFTSEEQEAVRQVEEIFGEEAWRYTIILFTSDPQSSADLECQLEEAGPELHQVLKKAGNRYHAFDNSRANNRTQVLDLLEKVEKMIVDNGGQHYSNFTYLEVVHLLDQREVELRKFYHRKLEEEVKAVELKYEKELSEAQAKRKKEEVTEIRRYYDGLKGSTRRVVEQTVASDPLEALLQFHESLKVKF